MINDVIERVFYPVHQEDWVIVETAQAFYELRMGGYKAVARFERVKYRQLHEFSENTEIEEAYTDDENLYFCLSNGEYLFHGFTQLDASGELSAMVRILSSDEFRQTYGESFFLDPDIRKLQTGSQGNSL